MELGVISAHRTVVLEGCDGVGKSTLAQRLALDFGFTIVHSARTPDGVNLAERYRRFRPGLDDSPSIAASSASWFTARCIMGAVASLTPTHVTWPPLWPVGRASWCT
jgi:hypothetical protein